MVSEKESILKQLAALEEAVDTVTDDELKELVIRSELSKQDIAQYARLEQAILSRTPSAEGTSRIKPRATQKCGNENGGRSSRGISDEPTEGSRWQYDCC